MYRVLTSVEALPELEQLLHRRTALGLDHRDEMWEGVLHMVPPAGGRRPARALDREVDDDGPVLVLTAPDGTTRIRPWRAVPRPDGP